MEHIQSAGCKLQKKSIIGAHNRCWKYLLGVISKHCVILFFSNTTLNNLSSPCVFYYCRTYYKAVRVGGGGEWNVLGGGTDLGINSKWQCVLVCVC